MSTKKTTYMLNMGPSHPSMHGVVRLVLELEALEDRGARVELIDAEDERMKTMIRNLASTNT